MVHCFGNLQTMVQYQFNKKYYAEVLCENKAKPKMNCNGKCALSKKLQKQEQEQQKTTGQSSKEKFETAYYLMPQSLCSLVNRFSIEKLSSSTYLQPQYYNFFIGSIFQPPRG